MTPMDGALHRNRSFAKQSAEVFRRMHQAAIALFAILMCTGFFSPPRPLPAASSSFDAIAVFGANRAPGAFGPEKKLHANDRKAPLIVDLKEIESDIDELDTRCTAAEGEPIAVAGAPLWREVGRALDGEEQLEPSRASTNSHLARGPPASLARFTS